MLNLNIELEAFPLATALFENGISYVAQLLVDARFLSGWRECRTVIINTQDRPNVIRFIEQDYGQRNAFIMAFRLNDIRFDSDEEIETND